MAKIDLKSPGSIPNYTLKKNLQLNDNYISNDGGDEGIKAKDTGEITINPSPTGALTFDAANEHLKITDFFDFKSITAFTISLWHYNNNDGATERILWKYHVDSDNYIQLKLDAGRRIRLDWVGTGTQGWADASGGAAFVTKANLYMDTSSNQTGFVNYWDHWAVVYDASEKINTHMYGTSNKYYFNVESPSSGTTANGRISWTSGFDDQLISSDYFNVGDIIHISGTTSGTNDGVYTITEISDTGSVDYFTVSSDGGDNPHVFGRTGVDDASTSILITSEPKRVKIYKNGTLLTKATNHNLTWSHHDAFNSQYASLVFTTTTITRSSGTGFLSAGFMTGMTITISGAATTANNTTFVIKYISETVITVATGSTSDFTYNKSLTAANPDNGAGGGNITLSVAASEKEVGTYISSGGSSDGPGFGDQFPPSTMAGDGDFYIGYTGTSLLGKLGETAIWSVPLSSDNIAQLYDNGSPYDASSIEKDSLLGYWKMTEINASNKVPNFVNPGINDFTAVNSPTVSTDHTLTGASLGVSSASTRSIRSPFYVKTNYITDDSGILLQSKNQDGTGGVFISSEGKVSMMDKSRAVYLKHPQGPSPKSWFNCGNIGDLNSANNWTVSGWYNTPFNTIAVGLFGMNGYEAGGESHISARITDNAKLQVWFYDLINSKETIFNEDVGNAKANQWHHYVFTYDNSKKAYIQSTGISVAQDGSSVNSLNISSGFTAAGFITVGMKIKVSGFTDSDNNGNFTVKSVSDTKIELDEQTLVAEAAGDTVTVESWGYEMFKAYRDGVEIVGTFDGHGSGSRLPLQSTPMAIGNSVVYSIGQRNLNGFYGLVGEHALWVSNAANSDATLTQAEVTKLYDNGFVYAANGIKIDFLIGYWKMVAQQASAVGGDGITTGTYSNVTADTWIPNDNSIYKWSIQIPAGTGNYGGQAYRVENHMGNPDYHAYINSTNTQNILFKNVDGLSCASVQMTNDGFDLLRGKLALHGNIFDQEGFVGNESETYSASLQMQAPPTTTTQTNSGQLINFSQKAITASGQTTTNRAIEAVMTSTVPTIAGTSLNEGINLSITSGTSGTQTSKGLVINTSGGSSSGANNIGVEVTQTTGYPIKLKYDDLNYASFQVKNRGELWIRTEGDDSDDPRDSDLVFFPDGKTIFGHASSTAAYFMLTSNTINNSSNHTGCNNYLSFATGNGESSPAHRGYLKFIHNDTVSLANLELRVGGTGQTQFVFSGKGRLIIFDGQAGLPEWTPQANLHIHKGADRGGDTSVPLLRLQHMFSGGMYTDIDVGSSGDTTIDSSGDIYLNAKGGEIYFADGPDNTNVMSWIDPDGFHINTDFVPASTTAGDNFMLQDSGGLLSSATPAEVVTKLGVIPTGDLLDEDDMATNSATKVASQQSIKAYVDGVNTSLGAALATRLNNNEDDTFEGTLTIDKDTSFTTSTTSTGIHVDLDHTGIMGASQVGTFIGANIDINTDSPSHHAYSSTDSYGLDIALTTNTNGATNKNTGINILCTGGDASHAYGIKSNVTDGGTDIALYSSADTGDYCTIATTTHGATTIATEDDNAAAANLTLDIDGDITLDSHSGVFIAKTRGTEFSAANSAYAGMILGFTEVFDDSISSEDYYQTTTTSFVNLSLTQGGGEKYLKVAFVVPPSNKVLIKVNLPYCQSVDGTLRLGLATDTSATTLHEDYERNVWDVDETDAVGIHYQWVIHGSDHSWAAGESKTLYVMIKEAVAGGRIYGGDYLSNYGAWTMEAVAFPATIADGS